MRPLYHDWPKHLQPPLGLFCWFIHAMSPTTGAIVIDDRVLEAETGLSYDELQDALDELTDLGYVELTELGEYLRIQVWLWDVYERDQYRSLHQAEVAYGEGLLEDTDEFIDRSSTQVA
jgi:hypothetical protein